MISMMTNGVTFEPHVSEGKALVICGRIPCKRTEEILRVVSREIPDDPEIRCFSFYFQVERTSRVEANPEVTRIYQMKRLTIMSFNNGVLVKKRPLFVKEAKRIIGEMITELRGVV